IKPYLDAVRAVNVPGEVRYYPGSPLIARHLMRQDDVLVANELNGLDFERLKAEFRRVPATTLLNIDARHAVKSLLPPKERRGVVLIDPPFEKKSEFADLVMAIAEATARFATGVFLLWYPLKDQAAADQFVAETTARAALPFLDVRLAVCSPFPGLGMTAAGVLILNPPYMLRGELQTLMPALTERLAEGEGSSFSLRDAVH
ncbi:MAG: 23S rRNA (adenine(2030)-N(6))-methyltransferase RlmJ, partial [Bryobacteraceae bacterium]